MISRRGIDVHQKLGYLDALIKIFSSLSTHVPDGLRQYGPLMMRYRLWHKCIRFGALLKLIDYPLIIVLQVGPHSLCTTFSATCRFLKRSLTSSNVPVSAPIATWIFAVAVTNLPRKQSRPESALRITHLFADTRLSSTHKASSVFAKLNLCTDEGFLNFHILIILKLLFDLSHNQLMLTEPFLTEKLLFMTFKSGNLYQLLSPTHHLFHDLHLGFRGLL